MEKWELSMTDMKKDDGWSMCRGRKDQEFDFEDVNLIEWNAIIPTLQSQFILLSIYLFVDKQ